MYAKPTVSSRVGMVCVLAGFIGAPVGAQEITADPDHVRLEVGDIRRLARVLRSIESEEADDTAAAIQAGYLANASPGLHAYAERYDVTAATIASTIAAQPSLYADLDGLADAILEQEDALRAAFQRLLDLFPEARFPPIWFIVGDNGAGGLTRREGVLVAAERFVDRPRDIVPLVLHELGHYQQATVQGVEVYRRIYGPEGTLLALALREGTAELIAELTTGRHINMAAERYGLWNEEALWSKFREEMDGTEVGDWLFVQPANAEWPPDLGYWIGYRIAKTYYDRADDKPRALLEILELTDFAAFLEASRYAETVSRLAMRRNHSENSASGGKSRIGKLSASVSRSPMSWPLPDQPRSAPLTVRAGRSPAAGWETAAPEQVGLDAARLDALARTIEQGELQRIRGVAVVGEGKLVFERYFNGATADEKTNVRSASKTILSALIGIAIERGEIPGVHSRLLDLAPRFREHAHPDPRKGKITVEDLLTMSSFLECNDNNDFSRGHEERMYLIEDWAQFYFDLPVRGFPAWTVRPEDAPFGRSWSYCTAGAVALGAILEEVTGQRADRYAAAYLFGPLGTTDIDWQLTPTGKAMTGGGVSWRLRDMAKFGQLYLDRGLWEGERVLPAAWVDASFETRAVTDFDSRYGYLWWIEDVTTADGTVTVWSASGNGGNRIYVAPALELVVAITSTNYNTPGMHEQARRILAAILAARVERTTPSPSAH